ncbi:MAG TPA: helix-turn-helix transcriptional regulator [Acidimicrobiia bacterium]|jgi:transcriptional regulator with XRE-family HTH domain|nr:helix-turn-helix transcriptional regulator [Acidimicrobiia bacterium]
MDADAVLRRARLRAGLSLRELAARAHTSHSTLAAYEAGRVTPTVDTFERVLSAAGFTTSLSLTPRVASDRDRSAELVDALVLASQFPARHRRTLAFPKFGRHGD